MTSSISNRLANCLEIQNSMEKNYYYQYAAFKHPMFSEDTPDEWKNFVRDVLNNWPVKSWSELQFIFRQTDIAKTKNIVSVYYKLPENEFNSIYKRYENHEISCEDVQDKINPVNYTQDILNKNKATNKKLKSKNYIGDKTIKEYNDFIYIHKIEIAFILFVYQAFGENISMFTNNSILQFFKKYGYDMEHTWNTHFNDVLDLSSVIPLLSKCHTGNNSKHELFGKCEIYKLINQVKQYSEPTTSNKKTKQKYLKYLSYYKPIYNMPNGKNKLIALLKTCDKLFYDLLGGNNHSTIFIRNLNEYFNLNIDENYIVNYVIES
jgi:hypothetical protein